MTRMTRRALLAGAATVAVGAFPCNSRAAEPLRDFAAALEAADPPQTPPRVTFTLPDGTRQLLGDYIGQGVILNLWATWCSPCVAEMPSLDRLAKALDGDRIAVLPLSSDRQGASRVDAFFLTHGVHDLPILLDPTGAVQRTLGVRGIPTTLIIDRQGREAGRVEGAVDWSDAATIALIRQMVGPRS